MKQITFIRHADCLANAGGEVLPAALAALREHRQRPAQRAPWQALRAGGRASGPFIRYNPSIAPSRVAAS